jgi:outer membrane protein assembly factor BamB
MRVVALLAVVLGALPAVARAAGAPHQAPGDWPQYGKSAAHVGRSLGETQLGQDRLGDLHVAFAGRYGTNVADESGPVVANGVAYVAGFDGAVSAFPLDGCGAAECPPLWQGRTRNDITATPAVANGVLYVASADHRLYAFRASGCRRATCPPLWKGRLHGADVDSPVTIAHGIVYVGEYSGQLDAFSVHGCGATICDPLWTGVAGGHLVNGSAVGGGMVFIPSDDGNLYAFSASGCASSPCAPLWTADLGGPSFDIVPTIAHGQVFVQTTVSLGEDNGYRIAAFRVAGCGAATCAPLWQGDLDEQGYEGAAAVANGLLYVATQNTSTPFQNLGVVQAFRARGCGEALCEAVWTGVNFASGFESSPVVADDVVYVAKGPALGFPVDVGVFAYGASGCGDPICPALQFVEPTDSANYLGSSLAVSDGRLLFGANDNNEDSGASKLFVLSTQP